MSYPALIAAIAAEGIPKGGGATDPFFANVSALLHFNGTFADVTGKIWTAGAGATITSSNTKFGSGALDLNGATNSNVASPTSTDFVIGTADFTIEFWVRSSGIIAGKYLFDGSSGNTTVIQINPNSKLAYYDPSAGTGGTLYNNGPLNTVVADGLWHHVAISRNGGLVRAFFDGVMWGSGASSDNKTDAAYYLGRYGASTGFEAVCDMDDVRITNGVGRYTANFTVPTSAFPDAGPPPLTDEIYWDNVGAMLAFEGTSGSTVFTDSTGKTWTRQGTVTALSNTQKKFGATSLFAGPTALGNTGPLSGITTPNHADFQPGKGDFTVEWQSYFLNYTTYQTVWSLSSTTTGGLLCQTGNGDGKMNIYAGSGSTFIAETTAASLNAWHEYKLVRIGTTLALYRDGAVVAFSAAATFEVRPTSTIAIGAETSGQYNMAGYIDEFRFTKGVGRAYVAQTSTYPTSQTAGQTRMNPKDIGPLALLTNNNLGVIPQGTSSTYGMARGRLPRNTGKYYFECSVLSAGASNFTLIGVAKSTAPLAGYPGFDTNGWGYYEQTGNKYTNAVGSAYGTIYTNQDVIGCAVDTTTGNIYWAKNNTWQNTGDPVAGTNPGFTGTSGPFYPAAAMANSNADVLTIGIDGNDLMYAPPTGYLPWGNPVSSVLANTKAQLHFEGANGSTAFTDSMGHVWTLIGAPTISNTQHEFGSTAGSFPTGANYIKSSDASFAAGTNDFCVEMWCYFTASGVVNQITGQSSGGFGFKRNASGTLTYSQAFIADRLTSTGTVALNLWQHVAFARANGIMRIFVGGAMVGAVADSSNLTATDLTVGGADGGAATNFGGYVDEFRYTVGEPRYVENFIPQRRPFADPQQTADLILHFEGADGSTSIIDAKGGSTWATSGGAQIATAQAKFGASSLFVNGGIAGCANMGAPLGTEFCVQGWANNIGGTPRGIFHTHSDGSASGLALGWGGGSGVWELYHNGAGLPCTGSVPTGWFHWAVYRVAGVIYVAINGVVLNSIADTSDLGNFSTMNIGTYFNNGTNWVGYLDEIGVTFHSSPYTSAGFSPPTTPFA